MSFENGTPEQPHNRFELPQQLIDDIDDIEDKYLAGAMVRDVEKAIIETKVEDESIIKIRAKIVELLEILRSLTEEPSGNSYADRKQKEFTIAQLKGMGFPVDNLYDLLGVGTPTEFIAVIMIEERDKELGPDTTETDDDI